MGFKVANVTQGSGQRIGGTLSFDHRILEFVIKHRTGWLDSTMRVVTSLGSFTVLTFVAVVAALVWRKRVGDWTALVLLALVAAIAWWSSNSLKLAFGRARPDLADRLVLAGGYSFPSGHATQSAAIWGTLALLAASRFPSHRLSIWSAAATIAVSVGVSRVYLGVHWFTDVIAGWALGAAVVGLAAAAIASRSRRSASRRDPRAADETSSDRLRRARGDRPRTRRASVPAPSRGRDQRRPDPGG